MDDKTNHEIIELALARSKALVEKDSLAMRCILADDFVYTTSSGEAFSKEDYIANFLIDEQVRWTSQELGEIEIWTLGDYMALSCKVHDVADFGDYHLDANFRSIFLYVKRGEHWYCFAGCTKALG